MYLLNFNNFTNFRQPDFAINFLQTLDAQIMRRYKEPYSELDVCLREYFPISTINR